MKRRRKGYASSLSFSDISFSFLLCQILFESFSIIREVLYRVSNATMLQVTHGISAT